MNEPYFKDEANNLIRNFGFDEAFLTGAIHAALRQMYFAGVQAGREEARKAIGGAYVPVPEDCSAYSKRLAYGCGARDMANMADAAIRALGESGICPANGRREGEE